MMKWTQFTLDHPWLSAAIAAGLGGLLLGLLIRPLLGVMVGVLGFLVVGMGQSSQSRAAAAEEKEPGKTQPTRGPLGRWMVSRPWLSSGVGGLLLAAGTTLRVVIDGATFSRAVIFGLTLGATLFLIGGLLMSAVQRRESSPR